MVMIVDFVDDGSEGLQNIQVDSWIMLVFGRDTVQGPVELWKNLL